MASNNSYHPNNQPRRKRNKKPVKRYSEEYSNRPNPYTGYSSDGNYHPGAKKRSMNEPSPVNPTVTSAGSGSAPRYDYSRAAMTDAVWPPANAGRSQPAAKPVSPAAGRFAESVPSAGGYPPLENRPLQQTPSARAQENTPSRDMAELAETAARLEGRGSPGQAEADGSPYRTGGSHRRKNINKQEMEQARRAKMEAKRAAVDKIARGVAAHSASEQMNDAVVRTPEAMESMAKSKKNAQRAKNTQQHVQKAPGAQSTRNQQKRQTQMPKQSVVKPNPAEAAKPVGVNWDEFYDAAFPPKAQESAMKEADSNAKIAPSGNNTDGKRTESKKETVKFEEVSSQNAPMTVKPVMLGEDDALPYDLIAEENAREAEEARAAQEAEAVQAAVADESEESMTDEDAYVNPPLEPADLIPVLDFGKPEVPAEEEAEQIAKTAEAVDEMPDETAAFESAAEQVNASEKAVDDTRSEGQTDGFAFGGEGWHEIMPPIVEAEEVSQTVNHDTAGNDDSVSLLSQRLLESYMAIEDAPLEYMPEDSDNSVEAPVSDTEITGEAVDLNQFFTPAQDETSVEVEVETPPVEEEVTLDASAIEEAVDSVAKVEIDIAEIADEVFAETNVSGDAVTDEAAPVSGEDAVKEKLEKMVEAAELADVLRQESDDTDVTPAEEEPAVEQVDIFSVLPPSERPDSTQEAVFVSSEDEVIKQYQPRVKPQKDENVFESVLIVDDSRSVVDNDAARKQDDMQFLHSAAVQNPTAVFKLPEGPIVLPTDIDDADFQEQWLDEDEDGDGMAKRTKRARRRVSAFIGGVAILFAVMILVSALGTVITGFNNIGSTNERKAEYSSFIAPVVLNDPAPFETLDKADNQMLLESAIWRVLTLAKEDPGTEFTYDATDKIVIPADQVAQAGRELFGSEVELNMNVLSESDGSAIYYYDSIDNSFHISVREMLGPAPVITKMAQKSDYVSLVVGYVLQDEIDTTSSNDNVECYKFMEYVLTFNKDDSYYIQSVRNYVDD